MTSPEVAAAVNRYSDHLHAVAGDTHHVVSPLGAWMLLALCGPLVEDDPGARRELGERLGADPMAAAAWAGGLLHQAHPLVSACAGLWVRAVFDNERARRWRAALPDEVATGDVPTQDKLDRWAAEKTMGLIDRFPLDVTRDVACVLASALATKVSWEVPFQVVDAGRLGPGPWSTRLSRILETPADPRHRQFITESAATGPLAVHLASARGGLLVGSVIAADAAVAPRLVLAEAERIVTSEAIRHGGVARTSLFDLPLGETAAWTISEEPGPGRHVTEQAERFTSLLPAWSARTRIDLTAKDLGFGTAAAAIAAALELAESRFEAAQCALARYTAVGFEAAAVSGMAVSLAGHATTTVTPRRAVLRFAHPYAVAAVAYDDPRQPSPPSWHGVPVFSAWVAQPEDA